MQIKKLKCSDVMGLKKLGSGPVRVQTVRFGLQASPCLDSQDWVFAGFLVTHYITNWGLGLVRVYVEKSGSGPVWVLDSWVGFLPGPGQTHYITIEM